MKYTIQFVQTTPVPAAEELVTSKLNGLFQKFKRLISADVFLKQEKGTYGKGYICEIRLSLPGPRIFASSDEESYEASIAETVRDVERQLKKRKEESEF